MAGPLSGVKVVEMVGIGPAPFCAMMLADAGADVLRVHPRTIASPVPSINTKYDILARGRKSVSLDLKGPGARDVLLEIVSGSDALLEGFRPGVMERLGAGPEDCLAANPSLVFGRMTGWGQTGPLAQYAGHDINYIGLSGVLNAIGSENTGPVVPLNMIGDFGGGGMLLAFGMLCALLEARSSRQGQVVDASMVEGSALLSSMIFGLKAAGAWTGARGENLLDGGAHFYGTYRCADGKWLAVGSIEPQFYKRFLEIAGLGDLKEADQMEHGAWRDLRTRVAARFISRDRQEWEKAFDGSDCCVTPVLDWDEAADHPHNVARGTFIEVDEVIQPAPAPRYSRTPNVSPTPPSLPQEGQDDLLEKWGASRAALSRMNGA